VKDAIISGHQERMSCLKYALNARVLIGTYPESQITNQNLIGKTKGS
jgi:hypothetical protein